MTEASDRCEGPYCSDMTITMQGCLYVTLAYSKERGNTLSTPAGDMCEVTVESANNYNDNNFDRKVDSLKTKLDAALAKRMACKAPAAKTDNQTGAGANPERPGRPVLT
jgi:hypothetical protein